MKPGRPPAPDLAGAALGALLAAAEDGFAEAAHVMDFPRAQGFSGPAESQRGDVFCRALIGDALQDAGGAAPDRLIEDAIGHLLARRRTDALGGWSYFPELTELPPDADDLAQVMRLFLRAGRRDLVEHHCEAALTVLLAGARDGTFPTWILPDPPKTAEQAMQAEWVRLAWGSTVDAEVVANLLHALLGYDITRFGPAVVAGANWLAAQQHEDGSWPATWYHGPWYGTWQAVRLLAAITPSHPGVARAREFLFQGRQSNGGWGLGDASDPLSTALALLALAATRAPVPTGIVTSGLRAMAPPDSGWPAVPFVRMTLGRAGNGPVTVLSYGSRTVTALFVLKATLALRNLC
jgi:squalene-hopene/tetraprenyl-beta-curcumene cyclase